MKLIIILLLSVFLMGCGINPIKPIVVENRNQQITIFHPPGPEGVILNDIEWTVLTPEIMEQLLKDIEEGKIPPIVFYALTPKGYEALSGNMSELKRYLKSQKDIIMYYRNLNKKADQGKK